MDVITKRAIKEFVENQNIKTITLDIGLEENVSDYIAYILFELRWIDKDISHLDNINCHVFAYKIALYISKK